MKVLHIKHTLRSTRRLAEILKVLSKFGFREVVVDLGLDTWLPGPKKEEKPGIATQETEALSRPVRLRMVLEELGPTFIKLGQNLSTRADLVPREWAEEFKKLQDNCPQVPFTEIHKVLADEFPGRLALLFSSIEEQALAAASMAQVRGTIFFQPGLQSGGRGQGIFTGTVQGGQPDPRRGCAVIFKTIPTSPFPRCIGRQAPETS